jgi:hypothetical protein
MQNPGLPNALWQHLDGRLWHATSYAGLKGILADGEIRVVGCRYTNSLARLVDGISLFDFGPSATLCDSQFSNWIGWFGRQQECRVPIWLEIDRHSVADNLIDAGAFYALWRECHLSSRVIPGVEACHRGPLPTSAVTAALLIDRYDHGRFHHLAAPIDHLLERLVEFERALPPPPRPNPVVQALADAWARRSHHNTATP